MKNIKTSGIWPRWNPKQVSKEYGCKSLLQMPRIMNSPRLTISSRSPASELKGGPSPARSRLPGLTMVYAPKVGRRIAGRPGSVILDLYNESGDLVEITAAGWRTVSSLGSSAPRFREECPSAGGAPWGR
ncbi:MAG: hypothetical protein ACR2NN_04010 [Bryobacteraceae bacterium]